VGTEVVAGERCRHWDSRVGSRVGGILPCHSGRRRRVASLWSAMVAGPSPLWGTDAPRVSTCFVVALVACAAPVASVRAWCADLEEFARPMMVPDRVQEVPILW